MYNIEEIKNTIIQGDTLEVLKQFPSESIDMIVTSPPYWNLRDYGEDKQLGKEIDPKDYINSLKKIFDECSRVLKNEGTLWVNIGDSYFRNGGKSKKNDNAKVGNTKKGIQKGNCKVPKGYKEKSMALIPERFVIMMSDSGWIVRNKIIWNKPNAMPQPVKDRFVNDYENIYLFSKNKKYYFNMLKENITGKERIKRTVWFINTKNNFRKSIHIAPYPEELVYNCIDAGCPDNGIVLDIFMGSGTTGVVAKKQNKNYIGIELNKEYIEIANNRIKSI